MLKRIFAIFRARNLEFIRDRGTMAWNLILPVMLMFGLSFIFSVDRPVYTVGVLQSDPDLDVAAHPFLETRYIDFVVITDEKIGFSRIARHQLDLLVQFEGRRQYWINPDSRKGYFVELVLLESDTGQNITLQKAQIEGDAVRYVDWVLWRRLRRRPVSQERFPETFAGDAVARPGICNRTGFFPAGVDRHDYLVSVRRHKVFSRHADGWQLPDLDHSIDRWRNFADIAGADDFGSRNERRTGWRLPQHGDVADDDVVRRLVFA
jgi:hypothetical protein